MQASYNKMEILGPTSYTKPLKDTCHVISSNPSNSDDPEKL